MALFSLWHERAAAGRFDADAHHRRLRDAAHIVPEIHRRLIIENEGGRWHLASFATTTHFYPAAAQVWCTPREACVVHGLIWRPAAGGARLLDAAAVAALLDRPGASLPADVAGEYAVVRLHRCGAIEAFGDPAGLHHLHYREDGRAAIASRAAFLALLADDERPDGEGAAWLAAIGYRVGTATGWRGVSQLAQGARLTGSGAGLGVRAGDPAALIPPATERGFEAWGGPLLEQGIDQARAAILLAAGDGAVDLPITGGKDSRVVLALALAAGLRDRLTLFTRGYAGHPDVIVGEAIAATLGLPHRREPPLGSDAPADLDAAGFIRTLATIAYQGDGGMGGWDNVAGVQVGRKALITGHFGELLKAYSKAAIGQAPDPVDMVRAQGPFDPLGLLRPATRDDLAAQIAAQMDEHRRAGALEADLPDLFYWRNRIPNWLGGIRGIKSFERQPVLPLGVPALMRLAFTMTPDERRQERAHFELVHQLAPKLLPLPFAHQSWHPALADAPMVDPVLAAEGTSLFGNWQWSINRNPAVRARLTELFLRFDVGLWGSIDRDRVLLALRERRFDYRDTIALLGLSVAAFHQAGMVEPRRLSRDGSDPLPLPPATQARTAYAPDVPFRTEGHIDSVDGAEQVGEILGPSDGTITINGWLRAPDWPGASPRIEARVHGRPIAAAVAEGRRPDLVAAGMGEGRYGFTLTFDATLLGADDALSLETPGGDRPSGGAWMIAPR